MILYNFVSAQVHKKEECLEAMVKCPNGCEVTELPRKEVGDHLRQWRKCKDCCFLINIADRDAWKDEA